MSEKQPNLSTDLEGDVLPILCPTSASAKVKDTTDGSMPLDHSS